MIINMHHAALTVSDIARSSKWYEKNLGFSVVKRYSNSGMDIALLQLGNCRLELFSFGKKTHVLPKYRHSLMRDLHVVGVKHFTLEVDNLSLFISDLKKKRVKFETKVDTTYFGGDYIFFKDCDGILVEAYEV